MAAISEKYGTLETYNNTLIMITMFCKKYEYRSHLLIMQRQLMKTRKYSWSSIPLKCHKYLFATLHPYLMPKRPIS